MYSAAKRTLDIAVSLIGMVLLAPVLSLVAAAIRLTMGAPVFFRQTRIGQKDRPFCIAKFRTMMDTRDGEGRLLPDNQRLTPLGRLVRRTSCDEFPQLWNVLRGDMSLVGPRPLLPQYLPRYTDFQRRRHEVKPGITGWAQVNGRNGLTWEQKFELDIWYVDNWSLWLDIRILWLTLLTVCQRDGISQSGHATAAEFMGNVTGQHD